MATIKINYGGTVYSMVKTSSKITTPSIKVDGGYIPCFKGDRFSEVLNGSLYYTLSPVCANGYRLACGTRTEFSGRVNLTLTFKGIGRVYQQTASNYHINVSISYNGYSVSTTQAGFTASISNFYISNSSDSETSDGNNSSLSVSFSATCSGNVTVRDRSGNVVKSFSFSKRVGAGHTVNNQNSGKEVTITSTYQIG